MYQSRYIQSIHIVVFYFFLAIPVTLLHSDNTLPLLLWISATTTSAIVNIAIQLGISILQVLMLQQLLLNAL